MLYIRNPESQFWLSDPEICAGPALNSANIPQVVSPYLTQKYGIHAKKMDPIYFRCLLIGYSLYC